MIHKIIFKQIGSFLVYTDYSFLEPTLDLSISIKSNRHSVIDYDLGQ